MRDIQANPGKGRLVSRIGVKTRALGLGGALFCCLATAAALAAEPPGKTFKLTAARGAPPATQRILRVEKDDAVRLLVTADEAGEVHVHAYRLSVKVTPATSARLDFKARVTGRFRVEWHAASAAEKQDHRHSTPLAILEVRPK